MSTSRARTAAVVGGSQLSSRRGGDATPPTPLDLLVEAATAAIDDAGGGPVFDRIDTVAAIPVHPWDSTDPAREVADALGLRSRRHARAAGGGQIGVVALNWAAQEIQAGRAEAVLLLGANVQRTADLAARRGVTVRFPGRLTSDPDEIVGTFRRDGTSAEEEAVGLAAPIQVYPILENALRAWRGLSIEAHRRLLGDLFAPFTEVAAANPQAWFAVARSAEELTTVTATNRMIGFPYPKYLNAVLSTDQAAAVVVMSEEAARAAGVSDGQLVYWWGGGDAAERAWHVTTRPDLAFCPSMRLTHHTALANARVTVDEVAAFDFYSCFPAPVQMALRVLGIALDDPRPFTVTGGLPYAGGPGSAYTLHSIAAMGQRLRDRPGEIGMVTGNGWYMTKHAAAILSSHPPRADVPTADTVEPTGEEARRAEPLPLRRGSGPGRIDSYTVVHDHDGEPEKGIVVGSFEDGTRFVANTRSDADLLAGMERTEMIGHKGAVVDPGGPALLFEPE